MPDRYKQQGEVGDTKPVADLMGADARAILVAVERGHARQELLQKDVDRGLEDQAAMQKRLATIREDQVAMQKSVASIREAAWATKTAVQAVKAAVESQRESIGDLAQQLGGVQGNLASLVTAVDKLTSGLESERLQRQTADKRIEGKVAVHANRPRASGEFAKPPMPLVAADPARPGSLSDIDHFEDITHNTFIANFVNRAKEDADFQREAARAGLGLRVMTWKSVLKWVGIIIAAAAAGGGIFEGIRSATEKKAHDTPAHDTPALPR